MTGVEIPQTKPKPFLMAFAVLLPTLITWVYFSLLASSAPAIQGTAYSLGKAVQFGLPIYVLWKFGSWTKNDVPQYKGSVLWGLVTGLAIAGAMYLLYKFVFIPQGIMDGPREAVREKLKSTSLDSLAVFAMVAIGYSLVHSLLEEYYWRWFVFGNLKSSISLVWAIAISSVGFALHHVIVLARYFGWENPWTYACTLSIAVGGAIWAWLYLKKGTLIGPWVSHGFVDAAIFFIGYELAF